MALHSYHSAEKEENCMDDLTVEQVIGFHRQVIGTDGGDNRLLSEAGLHQMVFSANRIDDVHHRAALALFTLVAYPAFREGNRETARCVAEMILSANGYVIEEHDDEMTALAEGIALFTVEQADIEEWFRSHSVKNQP
ncbi:MAG: type II toxin-antitoxin system death-on-curing family toxin [Methanoregula sp.]|nr:type II toxin-antitoxin system death-on-curing family toxin [Methanoregula sp.]